jgi:predicted DNA-binding transcriptional regulator AlpA
MVLTFFFRSTVSSASADVVDTIPVSLARRFLPLPVNLCLCINIRPDKLKAIVRADFTHDDVFWCRSQNRYPCRRLSMMTCVPRRTTSRRWLYKTISRRRIPRSLPFGSMSITVNSGVTVSPMIAGVL